MSENLWRSSTRLAQALFWGEYNETFSAGRSGVFEEGVVKVHLCSEVGSCPDPALLPQEDRKALGALVVLSPSLSFANSEFTFANNLRLNLEDEQSLFASRPFV